MTPSLLSRNLLIAAVGAALIAGVADFLFWGAAPGLSVSIFTVVLAGLLAGARRIAGKGGPVWPVLALLVGAAVEAAVDCGFSTICVLVVLFLILAGEALYDDRPRLWARAASQAAASLRFPVALPKLGFGLVREGLASPWGAASTLARIAAVVVPALAVGLLFALLLGAGNAVFGAWFGEAWKAVWAWLGTLSFGRICFALFTASVALTLLLPARVGPRWWGWTVAPQPQSLPEAPRYLRWQAAAVLGTVNLLFLAANGADAACLWFRHAMPAGVNPTRYVHEGTWALITAVILAGAVLAFFFRKRGTLLPQRVPRLLAYAWIGQCLFLLASVTLRLQLYVRDFGMTKTRVELACFLLIVGIGFVLLALKIARGKSLHWLAAGNALSVFALFYAVQFWDMGGFVAKWNVDRWVADPAWSLDVTYLASGELGAGAWKELRRVADASDRLPISAEAAGILREKWGNFPAFSWRSWQALPEWNRSYLGLVPPPCLVDAGWESALLFVPDEGISLLLERRSTGSPHAEYHRRLAVRFPDGKKVGMDVIDDTGGTVRMNVYRDPEGRYLFRDRLDYYQIDPRDGTFVRLGENPIHRRDGDYLGCFDAEEGKVLEFIPVSRRSEAAPPGMMEN